MTEREMEKRLREIRKRLEAHASGSKWRQARATLALEDVPWLLSEIDRLRGERDRLRRKLGAQCETPEMLAARIGDGP